MAIVQLSSALQALTDGQRHHECPGETVHEVLLNLEGAFPAMTGWLLDERRSVRRHINVFINGAVGTGDTPTAASDRVVVLPAITGGAG